MADPRIETVAKILVDYSVGVRPNQLVRINGAPEGAPLILAVYQKVLERGAHPFLQVGLEGERSSCTPMPAMANLITFRRL